MMVWVASYGQLFTEFSVSLLSVTWTLAWFCVHCLIPALSKPSIITIGSYVRVVHKTNQRLDGALGWVVGWDSSIDRWKVQLDCGEVVPAKPDQLLLTGVPDARRGSRRAHSPARISIRSYGSGSSDDSTVAPSPSPSSRQFPAPRPSQGSEGSQLTTATITSFATVATVVSNASGRTGGSRFEVETGEDLFLKRPTTLASEIGDLDGLRHFQRKVYRDVIYFVCASFGAVAVLGLGLFAEQDPFVRSLTSYSWPHQVLFTMSAGHFAAKIWEDWTARAYNALGICNAGILLLPCLAVRAALFIHNAVRHAVRFGLCAFTLATWGYSGFVAVSVFFDAYVLLLARRDLGFSRQVPPSWMCEPRLVRRQWMRTYSAFLLGRVPAAAVLVWFAVDELVGGGTCRPCSRLAFRVRMAFFGLVGALVITTGLEMVLMYSFHCTDLIWASTFQSRPKLMNGSMASRSHMTIIAAKSSRLNRASTWTMKSAPSPQSFNVDGTVTMGFWDQQSAAVGEWKMSRSASVTSSTTSTQKTREPMKIRRNSLGVAGAGITLEDLQAAGFSIDSPEESEEPGDPGSLGTCSTATDTTKRTSRSSRPSLGTLFEDTMLEDPDACDVRSAVELPPARIRTLGVGGRSPNDPNWRVFFTIGQPVAPELSAGALPLASQV